MKIAVIIARVLLGLEFIVFGLNAFLHFMPMPPIPGDAGTFVGILFTSHYVIAVALLQVVGGALLLAGRFVPLGLTLLGPIIVNIFLFHLLLAPSGLPMAIIVVLLESFLIWAYRSAFAGLFAARQDV